MNFRNAFSWGVTLATFFLTRIHSSFAEVSMSTMLVDQVADQVTSPSLPPSMVERMTLILDSFPVGGGLVR